MATPLPTSGRADQLAEHEHQGRRRHVAVAGEHVARGAQSALAAVPAPSRPRRGSSGRRHGPPSCRPRPAPSHCRARLRTPSSCQRMLDPPRHLAGQRHLEAGVADLPLDQLGRILERARRRDGSSRSPSARRVTRAAAAPSLNWSMASRDSSCCVSCRCSEQSSTVTASTRASGSERTIWYAVRSAADRRIAAHEADQSPLDIRRCRARGR